jgi:hypothetical protein
MWQFQNLKIRIVFLGAAISLFSSCLVLLFALSSQASSLLKAGSLKSMPLLPNLREGLEKTILFSKLCTFGKQIKKGTSINCFVLRNDK